MTRNSCISATAVSWRIVFERSTVSSGPRWSFPSDGGPRNDDFSTGPALLVTPCPRPYNRFPDVRLHTCATSFPGIHCAEEAQPHRPLHAVGGGSAADDPRGRAVVPGREPGHGPYPGRREQHGA